MLGASSITLAPLLRQMEAHAAGNANGFPKRFVFVVKSSGITPSAIRPEGIEIGDDNQLLDLKLKDIIRRLIQRIEVVAIEVRHVLI